ncbi:aspartate/glutamate racemase family protein [Lentibacillus saliphilus]|uniref:aspartate/glutamate racemase family protein n=1 Tax=Lentibacillus saliphilus TaxID=2737028 RepID=UPI001C2F6481|nr:aspartate/glutamate racemase family protein [Lentibacillus saliphilus]
MKTIGLIGGMSWESTEIYYRMINEEMNQRLGGLHSARCIMYSVDFAVIEAYQAKGEWNKAGDVLADAAQKLERAGADFIILCTNTMHKVIDIIEKQLQIPVLHIGDVTAQAINRQGVSTVGLLGTAYTMTGRFYIDRLKANGIDVIVPDAVERETINKIIFDELCHGKIRDTSRTYYLAVMNRLVSEGAAGIILGCTEIGMLIKTGDTDVPLFDTTMIHAKEAVTYALL